MDQTHSHSIILSVSKLTKKFRTPDHEITVLDNVSLDVESGSTLAIVGPSGSGKTTLLGLCAGLDRPSAGTILFEKADLFQMSEEERSALRRQSIGFVFQTFRLIPTLTALENAMVPLELQGETNASALTTDLLSRVGLGDRLHHYPAQLSGGEQQRVALARAFIHKPKILFADEPSGNLDTETSQKVIGLLFDLNQESGTTLILVTHDQDIAQKAQRIIRLKNGRFE